MMTWATRWMVVQPVGLKLQQLLLLLHGLRQLPHLPCPTSPNCPQLPRAG
jgi:hypothetical protein